MNPIIYLHLAYLKNTALVSKTEFCVSSSVFLVKAIREHFYLIGNHKSGIEFVNIYYALMVKTSRGRVWDYDTNF